jgi:hypothetical protein
MKMLQAVDGGAESVFNMPSQASSLLLRIRFARFTNVFSLAMEDLISLLGGVVFATLVGLGTSSLG